MVRRLGDGGREDADSGGDLRLFRLRRNPGGRFLLRECEIGDRVPGGDKGGWRQ